MLLIKVMFAIDLIHHCRLLRFLGLLLAQNLSCYIGFISLISASVAKVTQIIACLNLCLSSMHCWHNMLVSLGREFRLSGAPRRNILFRRF